MSSATPIRARAGRALVVAPDPARARALAVRMRHQGYRPTVAHDTPTAVAEARRGALALVVIDPQASEPSGTETARAVAAVAPSAPLYVLATDPTGAGRMRAVRVTASPAGTPAAGPPAVRTGHAVEVAALRIDRRDDDATLDDLPARLTPLEFRLLWTLAAADGKALDRATIHHAVWGGPLPRGSRVVDVLVRRLRRKVDEGNGPFTYVQTVPGVGYRLQAMPRALSA